MLNGLTGLVGLGVVLTSLGVACRSSDDQHEVPDTDSSPDATALVTSLRAQFTAEGVPHPLGESMASGFDDGSNGMVPSFSEEARKQMRGNALVQLPRKANDPLTVEDAESGFGLSVRMLGAEASGFHAVDGYAVYPNAMGSGTALLFRPTPAGSEDYLYMAEAPELPQLRYQLELTDAVAGLRTVSRALELLDATGTPRLRMGAPYIVDADARHHPVEVTLVGCDADADPAPPWGRPVTPPGSDSCELVLTWDGHLAYPALLDPAWFVAATMSNPRFGSVAQTLTDGRVLVASADAPFGSPSSYPSEVYDPPTDTWATVSSAPSAGGRRSLLLQDGTVFLTSGIRTTTGAPTYDLLSMYAVRYHPTTGSFSTVFHDFADGAEAELQDGRVLLVGGTLHNSGGSFPTGNAWLYDPLVGPNPVITSTPPSTGQCATRLLDGRVLLLSPQNHLFDPTTHTWSTLTSSVQGSFRGCFTMGNGTVLAMSGSAVMRFDPVLSTWSFEGQVNSGPGPADWFFFKMPDERIFGLEQTNLAFWGAQTPGWTQLPPNNYGYLSYASALLNDGRILVVGGTTTALYSDGLTGHPCNGPTDCQSNQCVNGICAAPLGGECASDAQCQSGFCADGHCCDSACGGGGDDCLACSNQLTGAPDGTCTVALAGTTCRAMADACDVAEQCDGVATTCPADQFAATGAPCGDQSVDCRFDDTCDGSGNCVDAGVWAMGASCGNSANSMCDHPDTCDAGGNCLVNHEPVGAPCGDQGITCLENDACDGAGSCLDMGFSSASTVCRPSAGACDPQELCDGAGACPPDDLYATGATGLPTCAPFTCDGVSATCPSSCLSDATCASGLWCDAGSCVAKKADGQPCAAKGECLSDWCADGVCCGDACAATCVACTAAKTGGADGVCAPVTAGTDPDSECQDGVCAGFAACIGDLGAPCPNDPSFCFSGVCFDGVCCDQPCLGTCMACDLSGQEGTCSPVPAGQDPDGECAPDVCDGNGACIGTLGAVCQNDATCQSGHCVDGVCCDATCGGGDPSDCQACNVPGSEGTCSPAVAGQVCRAAAAECDAAEACDGVATACPVDADLAEGTPCSQGQCAAGSCEAAQGGCTVSSVAVVGGDGDAKSWWLLVLGLALLRRRWLAGFGDA